MNEVAPTGRMQNEALGVSNHLPDGVRDMQAAFGAQFEGLGVLPDQPTENSRADQGVRSPAMAFMPPQPNSGQRSDGGAIEFPVWFSIPPVTYLDPQPGPHSGSVPLSYNIGPITPAEPAGIAAPSLVTRACASVLTLFEEKRWMDVREVLQSAWHTLTAPTIETAVAPRERLGLSPEKAGDLAALKTLPSLLGQAFLLGAFQYFAESTQNPSAWGRAMLTQRAYSMARIEELVDGYAAHFDHRENRAEAIQAALVRLSWLAPSWVRSRSSERHEQEACLTRAFDRLSGQLLSAACRLASQEEKNAFLDDVASAVQPAYCSPLLLIWVTRMPALIGMGVYREFAFGDIGRKQGLGLFPQTVNPARTGYWSEMAFTNKQTRLTRNRNAAQQLWSPQPLQTPGRPEPLASVAQGTTTPTHGQTMSPDPDQLARDWVESVWGDSVEQDRF